MRSLPTLPLKIPIHAKAQSAQQMILHSHGGTQNRRKGGEKCQEEQGPAFSQPPLSIGAISRASRVNFPSVVVPHEGRAPGQGVASTYFAGRCPAPPKHMNAPGAFQSHGGRSSRNRLGPEKLRSLPLWHFPTQ